MNFRCYFPRNFILFLFCFQILRVSSHDAATFDNVIEPLEKEKMEKLKKLPLPPGPPQHGHGLFPPNTEYGQGGGQYVGSETAPSVNDYDGDPLHHFEPITLRTDCYSQHSEDTGPPNPFKIFGPLFPGSEQKKSHRGNYCVPLTNCSSILGTMYSSAEYDDYCALDDYDGSIGICCDPSFYTYSPGNYKNPYSSINLTIKLRDTDNPAILPQAVQALAGGTSDALHFLENLGIVNKNYVARGIHLRRGAQFVYPPLIEGHRIGEGGIALVQVTRGLASRLGVSGPLNKASVVNTETGNHFCPDSGPPKCPVGTKRYRQIDGSCNNPKYTKVGQTFTPLVRQTYASYSDGVFSIRTSMDPGNSVLPSARLVSATVATGDQRPSYVLSYAFGQYGQLIAHDMSHVPTPDLDGELAIRCCTDDGQYLDNPDKNLHPFCLPIEIPRDDPFFKVYQVQCMPFIRSMVSSSKCTVGPADQMNQATHWMDLSSIYGSIESVHKPLREYSGGRLKSMLYNGREYLQLFQPCQYPFDDPVCFFESGDTRANHQLYLTVLHTIWNREHNRIAKILSTYHPEWSDETVFQETRKITIAEYQHINYNEMIPLIVGPKAANKFNLVPLKSGFTEYDLTVDGSVSNEHTTAAFRYGHSMMEDFVKIISNRRAVVNLTLHETIENSPYLFQKGVFDGAIRGLTRMSAENFDQWVTKELTQHLFQETNKPYGLDLAAINIQRARDHGLPSYAAVVNYLSEYCNLPAVNNFEDMALMIPEPIIGDYKRIYTNYADVDLWMGGLCENPIPGGVVGPTFACIIGNQFGRSKAGDRFYYEHGALPNSFTEDQLQSIRRVSAARLFCDNGDNIHSMQPLVFRKISSVNPLVNCSHTSAIPVVDLSPWQNYYVSE